MKNIKFRTDTNRNLRVIDNFYNIVLKERNSLELHANYWGGGLVDG